MALTSAQATTLKAAINANQAWAAYPLTSDGFLDLSVVLNQVASPSWYVARTSLSRHEILTATSDDNTTFAWAGAAYIGRSQGERDAFREMFNSTGSVNPSLPSISAAFGDIFSGAGGVGNRTHITALSRRPATFGEKALSTGTGSKAAPAVMSFEGSLVPSDIEQARLSGG